MPSLKYAHTQKFDILFHYILPFQKHTSNTYTTKQATLQINVRWGSEGGE